MPPILQRWRVRIAVRSADRHRSRFVFSGAAVCTPVSEARMMADYAIAKLGAPPENIAIEDRSRITVENVVNTGELIGDGPEIMIASNAFHARRARQVMHAEQPGLARDYIPLEWGRCTCCSWRSSSTECDVRAPRRDLSFLAPSLEL